MYFTLTFLMLSNLVLESLATDKIIKERPACVAVEAGVNTLLTANKGVEYVTTETPVSKCPLGFKKKCPFGF